MISSTWLSRSTVQLKASVALSLVLLVFGLLYCSISLVNHYNYRTSALDYGMFSHALWQYAHLKNALFTLDHGGMIKPFLSTHFGWTLMLYAPLWYLTGSYTLVLLQVVAILFGALGIYRYCRALGVTQELLVIILVIHFLSIWGIYSALSYDFHNNVIGAMLFPWLAWSVETRKLRWAWLFLILSLGCKEIMALYLFFFIGALLVKNLKKFKKNLLLFEVPALAFSLLYGILVIGYIMPLLQDSENNFQLFRFSYLGSSSKEIMYNIISHPFQSFSWLWRNQIPDPVYQGIKQETWLMLLTSGGLALILRPWYLIAFIPTILMKFLAADMGLWGINAQYSIELVPLLSIAVVDAVWLLNKAKVAVAGIVTPLSMIATCYTIESRISKWYIPESLQFYTSAHYEPNLNIPAMQKGLELIPPHVTVSASSSLSPWLVERDTLYHYPIVGNSEYIAVLKGGRSQWPLNHEDHQLYLDSFRLREDLFTLYEEGELIIFRRK